MAFKIPKIEWLNTSVVGDSHSNTTIDNIASTAALQVGMRVTGSGIPANTTIVVVNANDIVLSQAATSSLVGATFSFAFVFEADYQPIEKKGNRLDAKERVATSISGVRQVSVDFIEEIRDLEFSFLSQTLFNTLETFFKTHALYGRVFRYFEDKTNPAYTEYELLALKFEPTKIVPKGPTDFVWTVPMQMRRQAS